MIGRRPAAPGVTGGCLVSPMSEGYRIQLDVFSGPMDLLLYLVRRDEVDIHDIPIARITEQYLEYVRVLEQIDPNVAGDFLVLAATLVEIKSRALLPTPPLEPLDGQPEDPRAILVRQLLEYKRFKEAARALGAAADERAQRYVRQPADLPPEMRGIDLEEVQVWDLLEAFGRVMTAIGQGPDRHDIRLDDTPLELYCAEILAALEHDGPTTFQALFQGDSDRVQLVGRFLALLELVRARRLRAEQDRNCGVIYLFLVVAVEEPTAGEIEEPAVSAADSELGAPLPPALSGADAASVKGTATVAAAATATVLVSEAADGPSPGLSPQPENGHEPAQ